MDALKRRVENLQPSSADGNLSQETLELLGLSGVLLREYQIFGVKWLSNSQRTVGQQGCILGDEMGLGKTVQTLAFLLYMKKHRKTDDPILVLAPLSVLDNWQSELERWTPTLQLHVYMGDKDTREMKRGAIEEAFNSNAYGWKMSECPFDIFLTSYELCLKDAQFVKRFKWSVLVVDEAHRLKNPKSLLYQELTEFDISFKVLLTGTPVQNNLEEIYSLLSFISPNIFKPDDVEYFTSYFGDVVSEENSVANDQLHSLLKPFLLRRVKSEVMKELPKKSEVVLYTAMSLLQKKIYKAVLTKDYGAFQAGGPNRTRLMNILLQLRKCCNHPYIFPGVEPEPFEIGDHLIEASGKLKLLDRLLKFLKSSSHRVLVFSQFTMMLDIVQDYLTYSEYTYERLDGSVRGEERYLAVNNFNECTDTFIFLLSTRAGGQGLNLCTADTVIFLDSDFNPQNDLQAAARAHRIGQTRPVKIIRLVSKNTVEEVILKRAESKLKLTKVVIEDGLFSNLQSFSDTPNQLADILKFGLEDLFRDENSNDIDEDFRSILGGTINGRWIHNEPNPEIVANPKEEKSESIYVFEGHDYSKEPNDRDRSKFDDLIHEASQDAMPDERSTRREKGGSFVCLSELPTRKRKDLTEEEKEERRRKREEAAAKRAKAAEEEEVRKALERKNKREKLWLENAYVTSNIQIDDEGSGDESENVMDDEMDDSLQICYAVGDVTQPQNTGNKDAIIVHCVDDSGRWGSGGVFTALSRRSSMPKENYELAGSMKDLMLGDAHLARIDDRVARNSGNDLVALVVAQKRDKSNRLSPIIMSALTLGLERVRKEAKMRSATVHFPRIGYNMENFNWYGTERLIKKLFTSKGISATVYYYPRKTQNAQRNYSSSTNVSTQGGTAPSKLPHFFTGKSFYFYEVDEETVSTLSRYIIAYDGEVDKSISASTSYIIVNKGTDEATIPSLPVSTKIASTDWLVDCISKGALV